jgi:hypothetical protein
MSRFYKADFHVHTPESHCFIQTSEEQDENYLGVLRNAIKNSVDIIAITDHNTIEGYKRLLKIKEKYDRDFEAIKRYGLSSDKIDKLKEVLSLFANLYILPGIEYEAIPGIHVLAIFDPSLNIETLGEFVGKAGINPEMKGSESKGCGKWDVIETLEEVSHLGGFVIAAHCDRDKGIYKDLKHDYRIKVLTNENLYGIEFKNLENREKIKLLYKDPIYTRKYSVAFVQGSDFHNNLNQNIGNPGTFIALEEISFTQLKETLQNPIGNVSAPETPEVSYILKNLEESERICFIENYKDQEKILKAVISLANAGSGNMLIGENSEKIRFGIENETIESIKISIQNLIRDKVDPHPKVTFQILELNNKSILRVGLKSKLFSVYMHKDTSEVFIWENNKPRLAERGKITELLKENVKRETNLFLSKKIKRIETLSNQLHKLRDDLEGMYIISKFDVSPLVIEEIFDIALVSEDSKKINFQEIQKYREDIEGVVNTFRNGKASGNTVFLNESQYAPRLEETVLRYSAPLFEVKADLYQLLPEIPYSGESIILVKGGGAFYSPGGKKVLVPEMAYGKIDYPIVFLSIKKEYEKILSIKYLLAYLKSIPLLWLCDVMYDSVDIYLPNIFNNIPSPPNDKGIAEIESIVDEIMKLEKDYLKSEEELKFAMSRNKPERDRLKKHLDKKMSDHNELINKKNMILDNIIFNIFNIKQDEMKLMCKSIKRKNIYVNDDLCR